jgi:hypothetical protein
MTETSATDTLSRYRSHRYNLGQKKPRGYYKRPDRRGRKPDKNSLKSRTERLRKRLKKEGLSSSWSKQLARRDLSPKELTALLLRLKQLKQLADVAQSNLRAALYGEEETNEGCHPVRDGLAGPGNHDEYPGWLDPVLYFGEVDHNEDE